MVYGASDCSSHLHLSGSPINQTLEAHFTGHIYRGQTTGAGFGGGSSLLLKKGSLIKYTVILSFEIAEDY
jgi:hypothetical protein